MRQQVNSQRASAASTRRKLITSLLGANSSRRYSAFMATDDEEEGQPPLNVLQCCSDCEAHSWHSDDTWGGRGLPEAESWELLGRVCSWFHCGICGFGLGVGWRVKATEGSGTVPILIIWWSIRVVNTIPNSTGTQPGLARYG
jgi:hypothetical protein